MKDELAKVRNWAQSKLDAQTEPPWATRRYKDLVALIDEILASQAATISLEDLLRLEAHQAPALPQGENIRHIDSARRRHTATKVRLPM